MGYQTLVKELVGEGNMNLGTIALRRDAIALLDVIITQSMAVQRKTPVAVSTVSADDLDFKLGTQEIAESLKSVPGVYSTKCGGA